jgi:hypothetical protein
MFHVEHIIRYCRLENLLGFDLFHVEQIVIRFGIGIFSFENF